MTHCPYAAPFQKKTQNDVIKQPSLTYQSQSQLVASVYSIYIYIYIYVDEHRRAQKCKAEKMPVMCK